MNLRPEADNGELAPSRVGEGGRGRRLRRGRLYPPLAVSNPIIRVWTSVKTQPLGLLTYHKHYINYKFYLDCDTV